MQPDIIERIIYTQILTSAGFTVHALTELRTTRGGSVAVIGDFERGGDRLAAVDVAAREDAIVIDEQVNYVTLRRDGSFDLFTAHGDGD